MYVYIYILPYIPAHTYIYKVEYFAFVFICFFFVFFTPFIPFNLHWLAFEIFLSIPAFGGHYNLSAFIAVYISIYTHRVVYPPTTALYKCQFSFTKTLFSLPFALALCQQLLYAFAATKHPPHRAHFNFA